MKFLKNQAKHQKWCNDNGIKIYPQAESFNTYRLVVERPALKKPKVGDKIYRKNPKGKQCKWWEEIHRLYAHYYKMHNDKEYKNHFKNLKQLA